MRRWLGLRELYIQPVSDLAVEQRTNGVVTAGSYGALQREKIYNMRSGNVIRRWLDALMDNQQIVDQVIYQVKLNEKDTKACVF